MVPQARVVVGRKVVIWSKVIVLIVHNLAFLWIHNNPSILCEEAQTMADSLLAASLVVKEAIWFAKAKTWDERLIIESTS